MTRRERMLATMRGEAVDRPAFNFYEINGREDICSKDPFCIFSDESWHPLIALARDHTDRLPMCKLPFVVADYPPNPDDISNRQVTYDAAGSRIIENVRHLNGHKFRSVTHQDLDVNTIWTTEHWLKDEEDLRAWIAAPIEPIRGQVETEEFLRIETEIGDSGLVMLDTSDPLCRIAGLFDMATYTIVALTEPELFRQALDQAAEILFPQVEAVAAALPGRLWRIYGPEYASPPYLPPRLFREYVTPYIRTMVEIIHKHGGWVRVHSHGRLHDILDAICDTGCDGLDPIEPPHQGDVELDFVREKYGQQLVLFGNLEATDIENLPTQKFEKKIRRALDAGTCGLGRGFVLQPSASPYGRKLPALAMRNYEKIVELME